MSKNTFQAPRTTLRHANARMISRYMPWLDYMLTITFGKRNISLTPSAEQVHQQLRHFGCTLNSAIWKNRTRFNSKCQILYVPVVEGRNTCTRIHAHILLGHVKSRQAVIDHLHWYIPKSNWIAPRYDLQEIYDTDGAAWYLAKETQRVNEGAVAWELALIPKPLLPR